MSYASLTVITCACLAMPSLALAQDDNLSEGRETPGSDSGLPGAASRPVDIRPYIEAAQVLNTELSPGDDVVTYTRLAAGVDALLRGRNTSAAVSLRYERRIDWGDNSGNDGDTLSGLARVSASVIPRTLSIEAGAMASRQTYGDNGAATAGGLVDSDWTRQIYSVFAGPSFTTNAGHAQVEAGYRIGYTRVDEPSGVTAANNATLVDSFDDSVTQQATARISTRPGKILPVGLGLTGQWAQEDISNLDQRVRNNYLRADVTVPIIPELAVIGGVGYEDVKVSSRDVLRDENDNPVVNSKGRYVTDKSEPRQISYDADGLIWDIGVQWRPSSRMSLEAHYGHRYDSSTYYGSLSYTPDRRSHINLSVYDTISGFGGELSDGINSLSTDFVAYRNPISGDLSGCVTGEESGGNCLIGALGPIRSLTYRTRGAIFSYSLNLGRTTTGLGFGGESRKYITPEGPIFADYAGLVDRTYWVSIFASRQLDTRSNLRGDIYANWLDSGLPMTSDGVGWSASLAYYRNLMNGLTGTAALGLDGFTREDAADYLVGSALLGLRYSF
ncbi:preprotein translocase subunit YajC [Altericroceibacterium spongiae]|nr:preprotein translocase subunit YajC [Altericroceibacterium spongiae]